MRDFKDIVLDKKTGAILFPEDDVDISIDGDLTFEVFIKSKFAKSCEVHKKSALFYGYSKLIDHRISVILNFIDFLKAAVIYIDDIERGEKTDEQNRLLISLTGKKNLWFRGIFVIDFGEDRDDSNCIIIHYARRIKPPKFIRNFLKLFSK